MISQTIERHLRHTAKRGSAGILLLLLTVAAIFAAVYFGSQYASPTLLAAGAACIGLVGGAVAILSRNGTPTVTSNQNGTATQRLPDQPDRDKDPSASQSGHGRKPDTKDGILGNSESNSAPTKIPLETIEGHPDARDTHSSSGSVAQNALAKPAEKKFDVTESLFRSGFLAGMSHELRTPLGVILGMSEALQDDIYGPLAQDQRAPVQQIEASGRHLLQVINEILDFSKAEAGQIDLQMQPIEIEVLADECVKAMLPQALTKGIELTQKVNGDLTGFSADLRRLKQIIMNLIANGVKFTKAKGKVGLDISGDKDAKELHFSIWDTGIGIAPADTERIFEPYVQLDDALNRKYGGTGVGLALVKRMVEWHNGRIQVDSEPGHGSRFTVSLPWGVANGKTTVVQADHRETLQRILYFEDSELAATQVQLYLKELGVECVVNTAGTNALRTIKDIKPDAILLDIILPDISGWEILELIKKDDEVKDIPVVIVSAVDQRKEAFEMGAQAYLVKPINRNRFRNTLRQVFPEAIQRLVTAKETKPPTTTSKGSILMVEDDMGNIHTLQRYLNTRGYSVSVALNGQEGLDYLKHNMPDIIIMDIQMPVMGGLEAIQAIRADARVRHLPIIALTALAMPGDREACLEAGADDYLSKPVTLKELAGKINDLLIKSKQ